MIIMMLEMNNNDHSHDGHDYDEMVAGRGLKAAGRYKRFRDLYCVVEVTTDDGHHEKKVVCEVA